MIDPAIAVRRAEPRDADTVADLFAEYFEAIDLPLDWRDDRSEVEAFLVAPCAVWLAFFDGTLAGMAALRPVALIAGACELKRLYVRAERRGLGIADALLDAFDAFALNSGYDEVYLDSRPDMLAAHALYRRRGYALCERYNDNPEVAHFMHRVLRG